MPEDRRKHRRLAMRLPLDCRMPGVVAALRSCTRDISTGGVFFELEVPAGGPRPEVRAVVSLDVRVPPGLGYSPYQGRVSAAAEIVRCSQLEANGGAERFGVAAQFKQPLQLRF